MQLHGFDDEDIAIEVFCGIWDIAKATSGHKVFHSSEVNSLMNF